MAQKYDHFCFDPCEHLTCSTQMIARPLRVSCSLLASLRPRCGLSDKPSFANFSHRHQRRIAGALTRRLRSCVGGGGFVAELSSANNSSSSSTSPTKPERAKRIKRIPHDNLSFCSHSCVLGRICCGTNTCSPFQATGETNEPAEVRRRALPRKDAPPFAADGVGSSRTGERHF